MAREIPEVVRAAAGLAATVLDEARKLPETLPGLPVRVIGLAMQHAMKVQQQYAGLVARGDELFTGIRGDREPGLATFDDDDVEAAPANGFRDSAFDRAGTVSDAELDEAAAQVDEGQTAPEELAAEAPATEDVLEELAVDELVEAAPTLEETAPAVTEDADAIENALLESSDAPAAPAVETGADVSTTVDVLTADGGDVTTVDATVTDEGVAAPVTDDAGADATAVDEGGTPVAAATTEPATAEPATAPVEGYDGFSIAQLRGRLRGYALSTVADLVSYEEANRAREPYLRMLRNRLEKLEEQAVESSPLAPRGQ
ncbi:hypothetical protein [Blastococcus sp. TF02A-30]|uniref:hypothetical protein n=1 Tax=Blastococcus sp. TF02A-30 TaxID=2250580 RepID=UPI000DE8594F|nr:hypothetical protein [Blastococcus sp. TF02A-30]RBY89516.1 hypothetical protein DQ241_08695 [Blastococcus sp. TF02A-30]